MKTSLAHLPERKVKEVERIAQIIRDEAPCEKIILFGSPARGDWVSDKYHEGHITYDYKSDYDILVIVRAEKVQNDTTLWDYVKRKILNDSKVFTTVNLIVDTVHFVNQKLSEGNYFYADIKNEGVVLYDRGGADLSEFKVLDPVKRKELIKKDYEFWMGKAAAFLKDYAHNIKDGELSNAAFHLSQAVESLYFTVLLVFTGYKPKSHNLEKIEDLVTQLIPDVQNVFPRFTEAQIELYNILVRAYIDARYKQDFEVTLKQLNYLNEKVDILQRIVTTECAKKIAALE